MTNLKRLKEIHEVLKNHTWVEVSSYDIANRTERNSSPFVRRVCSTCHTVEIKNMGIWVSELSFDARCGMTDKYNEVAIEIVKERLNPIIE
jgi:hypothetical protein